MAALAAGWRSPLSHAEGTWSQGGEGTRKSRVVGVAEALGGQVGALVLRVPRALAHQAGLRLHGGEWGGGADNGAGDRDVELAGKC